MTAIGLYMVCENLICKLYRGLIENMKNIEPFVRSLRKRLPDIPVEYVDERFTSVLAHRTMLEAGLKKKDRQNKALVDEISATIILQSYLESKRL